MFLSHFTTSNGFKSIYSECRTHRTNTQKSTRIIVPVLGHISFRPYIHCGVLGANLTPPACSVGLVPVETTGPFFYGSEFVPLAGLCSPLSYISSTLPAAGRLSPPFALRLRSPPPPQLLKAFSKGDKDRTGYLMVADFPLALHSVLPGGWPRLPPPPLGMDGGGVGEGPSPTLIILIVTATQP